VTDGELPSKKTLDHWDDENEEVVVPVHCEKWLRPIEEEYSSDALALTRLLKIFPGSLEALLRGVLLCTLGEQAEDEVLGKVGRRLLGGLEL